MLTKRLEKIVSVLPRCNVLADVGCDHGYVGLQALTEQLAHRVIFIDVSAASLEKARRNCLEPLKTQCDFVCQDGLQQVCADCAVIAGMGGLEIISVLEGALQLPDYLVLQPMRNQKDVRLWLSKYYDIITDEKFFDGKFYDLISAVKVPKGRSLSEEEVLFGKNLQNPTQDFVNYLLREKNEYQQILQQHCSAELQQKLDVVTQALAKVTEELK